MPDPTDSIDVPFPAQGVDVSVEYDRQPPGTTPIAVNVRTQDIFLNRERGGSREGLAKFGGIIPAGSTVIQNLTQLVDPRAQLVIGSFEDFEPDFIPDPRNPARSMPPEGSGEPQVLGWPPAAFRRVQIVPSATTVRDGQTVTLTVTLTDQPGNTPVPGTSFVSLKTDPPGRQGDGNLFILTNGVGTNVIGEVSFLGPVVYFAYHTYTEPGFLLPLVARGICVVTWTPDLQIAISSPDGTALDADGKSHPLVGTLTKISNGSAVAGKLVRLFTVPAAEAGYGAGRYSDANGQVTFRVSDTNDETVIYQIFTPPPGIVASAPLSIQWGPTPAQYANNTKTTGVVSSTTIGVSFANSVAGHLITVGVVVSGSNGPSITSVMDSLGTVYAQQNTVNDGTSLFGFVWTGKPTASGANTITVTIGSSPAAGMAIWLEVGEYSQRVLAAPVATKAAVINYSTPTTSYFDDAGQLAGSQQTGHLYVGFVLAQSLLVNSETMSPGFTVHDQVTLGSATRLLLFDSINPTAPIPGAVRPTWTYTTSVPLTRGDLIMTCDFPPTP